MHFLAPEVLQGRPFSVASDIYAAGITLFQLVTGVLPFDGSTKDVAEAQVKKEFPRASNYVTSIPKEFEEHFNNDRFKDSLERIRVDIEFAIEDREPNLSGRYEMELAEMLRDAMIKAEIVME